MRVLVTGGAGFIGSHTVDKLLEDGHDVVVLDCLLEQSAPHYIHHKTDFIRGDVRDKVELARALEGVEGIIHLAAIVGVAQSMYEIKRYVSGNDMVTAALWEGIRRLPEGQVRRVVVASSMSIYGEGLYYCERCGVGLRSPMCRRCGCPGAPVGIGEGAELKCRSVYALGKKMTEELSLLLGQTYGIPTAAMRYFNVYGPRQSLNNSYTGLMTIAIAQAQAGKHMVVFEDGQQVRDFIHVTDVARANVMALTGNFSGPLNIGTGIPTPIMNVVEQIYGYYSMEPPEPSQRFRAGDIRHCYADVSRAVAVMDFSAKVELSRGLESYLPEAGHCTGDVYEKSMEELQRHKLIS